VLDQSAPGDRIVLGEGTYTGVTSHTQRVQGGTTWAKRTRIEARVRLGVSDHVVFVPDPARPTEPPLRLAHAINSNLEVVGIAFDAQAVAIHAVKVGATMGEEAGHVRFTDCEFTGAILSGLLATGGPVSVIRGVSHHNGTTPGLDHGLYLACDSAFVSRHDSHDNFANGIKISYGNNNTTRVLLPGRIEYCRAWNNGRENRGSGILVATGAHTVERCTSWDNNITIQVFDDGHGVQLIDNVVGKHTYPWQGPLYIAPAAQGVVERGTRWPS
jgi:hypothetical protein